MVSSSQRLAVAIMCLSMMCLAQPRTNFNRIFGPTYGKRSQTGMRPVNYLNLVDEGQDSDELQKDQVGSSLALFLARLSPEKRHILSQLLAMPRMNNDNTDE